MSPRIGDFGVNSPCAFLIASALRLGERVLIFLEVPRVFDLAAIGERGECAQTEINANFAGSAGLGLGILDLQAEIPAPTGVLRKASALDFAIDWTATPKPITAFQIDHRVAIDRNSARSRERNPPKALLAPPMRAASHCIAIGNESLADSLHCVAVQTEERTAPGRQPDQIEDTRPTLFLASRRLLGLAAIIPDAVDRQRMSAEALGGGCILDAVSIGEEHALYPIR